MKMSQATMQQMGGKGNLKRNPSKMGTPSGTRRKLSEHRKASKGRSY